MAQLLNVVKSRGKSLGTKEELLYGRAGSGMVGEGQACTGDPDRALLTGGWTWAKTTMEEHIIPCPCPRSLQPGNEAVQLHAISCIQKALDSL